MLTPRDKAVRKRRITGTRIGGILGLSKYKTPIDVFREVREGRDDVDPDSPDILRGRYLEDGLRAWWCHLSGEQVRIVGTVVHPKYDFLASTSDGIVLNTDASPRELLELKAPRNPQDWGPDGTDEIPDYHIPQVALEMACADLSVTNVAALVYGELRRYRIERDLELEREIIKAAKQFWEEHILTGVPPPVDETKAYSDYLVERFPQRNKTKIRADAEQDDLISLYFDAQERRKRAEAQEDALRNQLCKAIGDAGVYGLTGTRGSVVWYEVSGRSSLDIDGVLRELGADPEILQRHRRVGKTRRQFKATPKKG